PKNRDYFRAVFRENFPRTQYIDNFVGLINAAVLIVKLRNTFNEEKKPFDNREYFVKETEMIAPEIKLDIDFSGAENVLGILSELEPGSDVNKIFSKYEFSNEIKNFFKSSLEEDEIIECFENINSTDHLTRVYMIANPLSFLSLGGVYVFRENYRKTLDVIKKHEYEILSHVSYLLSLYFPEKVYVSNKVYMLYGSRNCGWRKSDGSICFDLSRFGNDYDLMTRYLTREMYYDKKKILQLGLGKYFFDNEDTLMYNLLSEVYSNGIANYIAPILKANRPSALLEKDFMLFKKTEKSIRKKEPGYVIDSLFNVGINDMYFYSMGAQMAYCIDVYSGRNVLRNTLLYGPIYFFKTYIDTYKLEDSRIRKVFRLPAEFEKKLHSMNYNISYDILTDVMQIKIMYDDFEQINSEITKLFTKYKNRRDLWFLHLNVGKLFMDKGYYENSFEHFMLSIQGLQRKSLFVSDMGDRYFANGAFRQSLGMYDKYVVYSTGSPDSYLKRGMAYFELGEREKAMEDFKMTLSLDPENIMAKEYLDK
ncbi:MAG: tetratricopeptide repeat protein, partial [Ignavibacteria bacterium]|nr:tetratricopeptide repeat protein [Ignavibacteria bacterium]